jgi:molybdopterin/thiamine biosynthesis adenylyltransferase
VALADYYERAALAASQVIAGFVPDLFRTTLEDTNVGLAIDREASTSGEGEALAELSIRLLARLYPCLEIRAEVSSDGDRLESLARMINPRIEFKSGASIGIGIGRGARGFATTYFAGSDGWDALLSTSTPVRTGRSPNPFGAGAAACLAVGRIFNHVVSEDSERRASDEVRLSTFLREKGETPRSIPNDNWKLCGDAVLVGVGAVGNGAVWGLGRSPINGTIHIVDHEALELSNLQRYVLASRVDDGRPKVDIAAPFFSGSVTCVSHQLAWADFVENFGYGWQSVLVALDSAADRRSVQAALPKWIANAWTQPGDLGVSVHGHFDGEGACLACLYLQTTTTPNEDEIVAAALGIPQLVGDVRTLLHSGAGVGRPLLEAVAQGLQRSLDEVLQYQGRSIRELYVEGICGGGLIPLGMIGLPRQELHVPLAHQSALAGVLLGAALMRRAVENTAETTMTTRIDVTKPLGDFLTQPTLKAQTGLCICEDQDFVRAYQAKFGDANTLHVSSGEQTVLVFQYGSNTSRARLNAPERLNGDARDLGLVRTREPFEFDFDVWSEKNQCFASDIRHGGSRQIWGVLYEIPAFLIDRKTAKARGRQSLDAIEGKLYARREIAVEKPDGTPIDAPVITYTVIEPKDTQPTSLEYVTHILSGLREHNAPADYIAYVKRRIIASNTALAFDIEKL